MSFGYRVLALCGSAVLACSISPASAQNADLMQKLQQIKASSAANKAALAHYTWQESESISLKGEVKKTTLYQVTIGPDGKQQKTEIGANPASAAAAAPSGGRFKQRIVAKKKEEYQEYGEQMSALAKQYTASDPELLQDAYQKGNISAQLGGASGTISLVIKNYIKPGDSMTMVFNQGTKAIEAVNVATYLSAPSDAMTLSTNFAKLPDGTNHVASVKINGVSKQLGVNVQNSNYEHVGAMAGK
jgi:hypothetical protein